MNRDNGQKNVKTPETKISTSTHFLVDILNNYACHVKEQLKIGLE